MWTLFDRRVAYPRLARGLVVLLRYFLAAMMLSYGLAKLFVVQFPPLWLERDDHTLGQMSPMGLLWTFMSYSTPYTIFTGVLELAGALLLLSRRTSVIGALVIVAVMTNVVVLNLCYDVPVKLFSMELLAMAIAIVIPDARRLLTAAFGRATPDVPPPPRGTLAVERIRLAVKLALLVSLALRVSVYSQIADQIRPTPTALHGAWRVERFVRDGVEQPPLYTDDARWRRLTIHEYGATIRYATDRREHFRIIEVDPATHTLTFLVGIDRHTLRYERPTPDRLVLDGTLRDHALHVELALEPTPPLRARGFHWIQEAPFNR